MMMIRGAKVLLFLLLGFALGVGWVMLFEGFGGKVPSKTEVAPVGIEEEELREDFIGKWEMRDGEGDLFCLTIYPDGTVDTDIESGAKGYWEMMDGQLRVDLDNGWIHMIVREGDQKYKKVSYRMENSANTEPDQDWPVDVGEALKPHIDPIQPSGTETLEDFEEEAAEIPPDDIPLDEVPRKSSEISR